MRKFIKTASIVLAVFILIICTNKPVEEKMSKPIHIQHQQVVKLIYHLSKQYMNLN